MNWKFERVVLPVQPSGILGPNRVGERVKVMKYPSTGEYVMYMHADDMNYKDPHIGYATCSTIAGEYKLHGPLLYEGKPIRRWSYPHQALATTLYGSDDCFVTITDIV